MVLFSIIIPHYNIPDLLIRCLRSIPVREDVQVIVVDDCSAGAEEYKRLYPELSRPYLEMYSTPIGGSAGRARNVGLDHSKGKWLIFADADDMFTDIFESVLDEYKASDKDLIFFYPESGVLGVNQPPKKRAVTMQKHVKNYLNGDSDFNLRYCNTMPWSRIIRHSLVKENDIRFQEIAFGNDVMFSIKVGYYAKKIGADERSIYRVYYREGSLVTQQNKESASIRLISEVSKYNFLRQHGIVMANPVPAFCNNWAQPVSYYSSLRRVAIANGMKWYEFDWNYWLYLKKYKMKLNSQTIRNRISRLKKRIYDEYSEWCKYHYPKKYAEILYKRLFGYSIDWKHPRDLNEKIHVLSFCTDTTEWSRLADKYRVREFVKERGCEEILIPLLGCWKTAEEINFDSLPDKFVLKCNNGYADATIIKDKATMDRNAVKRRLGKALHSKFGIKTAEPHYLRIEPRIIAEELLEDEENGLIDYKVFCFNGKPYCIVTCSNRDIEKKLLDVNIYDLNWNSLNNHALRQSSKSLPIARPNNLELMLSYAAKLSKGFPQVRVDLYNIKDKVYFGEMTFTAGGGRIDFMRPEFLKELGEQVIL